MVNREKLISLLSKSDCSLKQRVVCEVLCVLYLYFLHQRRDLYYQEEIMISLYSGSWVKSSLNVKQTFYGQAWECHFFLLHCPTDYSGRLKLQIEGSKLKTNWALRAKVFWGQLRRLRQRNNCFWIPHYPAGGAASSRSARVLCCDATLHPTTFTYCAICQSHLAPSPTSLMTTNPFPFVSCWRYFSEVFRKHLQTLPVGFLFFFKRQLSKCFIVH